MLAIVHIAVAEFGKAFAFRIGTAAARDFLWLTVFFTLSAFLVFVGWSAREGVWQRFQEVLLGALPGSGPPIRISTHIDRPEQITAQILDKFDDTFRDLDIVPMRELDGQIGAITFPGLVLEDKQTPNDLSWGRAKDGAEGVFRSYAIPLSSPLWQWVKQRSGQSAVLEGPAPLVIAANRALFQRHFRYANYRSAVTQNLKVPCTIRDELPEKLANPDDPTELDTLVLEVKEAFGRSGYYKFKVIWMDSFPLPEQVAYLLPLPTVEVAEAAEDRRGLEIFYEGRGKPVRRISSLRLKDIDVDSSGVSDFQRIAACLGAVDSATAQREQTICGTKFTLPSPGQVQSGARIIPRLESSSFELQVTTSAEWSLRLSDVKQCTRRTRFSEELRPDIWLGKETPDFNIEWTKDSSEVAWTGFSRLDVPCDVLVSEDRAPDKLAGRQGGNGCLQEGAREQRGIAWLSGYPDAMVYARSAAAPRSRSGGAVADGLAAPRIGRVLAAPAADEKPAVSAPQSGRPLDEIVQKLLGWTLDDGRPVFRLDPTYESALVRFGVLSKLVDLISVPIGGGMVVLYLVLSGVILATAFLHRRPQYGLLFMNGVKPWRLEVLVCIQISLGCFIGCVIGYLGFITTTHVLNAWLSSSDIIKKAADVIGFDSPTFLDNLTVSTIVMIWFMMTFASVAVGSVVLRIQGISVARAPIDLIKS
jgi:hypothetical protein